MNQRSYNQNWLRKKDTENSQDVLDFFKAKPQLEGVSLDPPLTQQRKSTLGNGSAEPLGHTGRHFLQESSAQSGVQARTTDWLVVESGSQSSTQ